MRYILLIVAVALCVISTVRGQSTNGSIDGVVSDTTGAVISVRNRAKRETRDNLPPPTPFDFCIQSFRRAALRRDLHLWEREASIAHGKKEFGSTVSR